jgi:adenylate kinase
MRLVFLGPPGSGKGTQAKMLRDAYGLVHVSTGNMIREAMATGTPTGAKAKAFYDRGALVPDPIIVEMVVERIAQPNCRSGFLLDGFPRTRTQAVALERALDAAGQALDAAMLLQVEGEEIVRRLSGRRICSNCNEPYHIVFLPPRVEGQCDRCGHPLIQREDDRADTIRRRLRVYHRQTEEVAGYYREKRLLRVIPGMGSVEEIQARIREALGRPG